MKRCVLGLVCICIMFLSSPVKADVIDFENIPGADPLDWNNPVPSGYGGLNWDWVYVLQKDYNPGTGFESGVVSGNWAAYNVWNLESLVTGTTFDFIGAYFTSAWDTSETLTITGYSSSGIQTATVLINDQTPTWFQADWTGLDTLSFSTTGNQFVMDDFTYTPVPLPSTVLLLLPGLLGLIGIKRRNNSMPS